MFEVGVFNNNIQFLNLKGHPNCITGSRVMVILLNGCICLLVELHREGSATNEATLSSFDPARKA